MIIMILYRSEKISSAIFRKKLNYFQSALFGLKIPKIFYSDIIFLIDFLL